MEDNVSSLASLIGALVSGGVVVSVMLTRVLDRILPGKNNNHNKAIDKIALICEKIERQNTKLVEQHSAVDSDGVPLWYVRRSLVDAVNKQTECSKKTFSLMSEMKRDLERMRDISE